MLEKMLWTLAVIFVILAILVALPILIGFGAVLLPVLGVIAAVLFIPICIGIWIGSKK